MANGYMPAGYVTLRDASRATGIPRTTLARVLTRLAIVPGRTARNRRVRLLSTADVTALRAWEQDARRVTGADPGL